MALFFVDVRHTYNDFTWSNNWTLEAPDLTTAAVNATDFANFHRALLSNQCQVEKVITSTIPDPGRTSFIETPVGAAGLLLITANALPALWTVAWLDLIASTGRPGRKFLRAEFDKAFMVVNGDRPEYTNFPAQQTQVLGAASSLLIAVNGAGNTILEGKHIRRPVTSIQLHGIALSPTNHKYFDKAGPK